MSPDEATQQALLLRNLRQRKAMDQDVAYYDRLPPSDSNNSYDCLRWSRDELSRSIGGGWVNPVGKGKGKGNGKGGAKGRDKP